MGTGLRRLTDGGKDNNAFDAWSEDGKQVAIDSSRLDPAARDSFLIDVASGSITLVCKNPGVGDISNLSTNGRRALLGRVRSRGDSNIYLLDLQPGQENARETLLTKHDGVALFFGVISPDGSTAYIGTNKDRDRMAFGRIRIAADGPPSDIEILAERAGAELDALRINKQGTMAVLVWNVKGRSELSFYDLKRGKELPPQLKAALEEVARTTLPPAEGLLNSRPASEPVAEVLSAPEKQEGKTV